MNPPKPEKKPKRRKKEADSKAPNVPTQSAQPLQHWALPPVHPLPPGIYGEALSDRRSQFAQLPAKARPDRIAERDFIARKLKLLQTHPAFHPLDRLAAVRGFQDEYAVADIVQPIPGGVGYGMFYNDGFKSAFATGTAVSWEIICPSTPGGNVSDWLYITATNRSGKGVEAFVSYHGNAEFAFNVFDWARPENERWQLTVPLASLGPYVGSEMIHGVSCQVIAVINTTSELTAGSWTNEVRLLNVQTKEWNLVYQFQYSATIQDQTGSWVGSWGPIVETFQDVYSGTNVMGALVSQMISRDSAGNWSPWMPLSATQSDLRVDNKGFVPVFLDPNYAWAVHS